MPFTIDDSSDEELLPIEALMPWLYKGVRSPAKAKTRSSASGERLRYEDPAEEAIPYRRKRQEGQKNGSEEWSSTPSNPAVASSASTSKRLPSRSNDGQVLGARRGNKQTIRSSLSPPPQRESKSKSSSNNSREKSSKRAQGKGDDVSDTSRRSSSSSRGTSVVLDSEADGDDTRKGGDGDDNLDGLLRKLSGLTTTTTAAAAPLLSTMQPPTNLNSIVFGQPWATSSPAQPDNETPSQDRLASLPFPTSRGRPHHASSPSRTSASDDHNKTHRARRLTIIEIPSDSDDEKSTTSKQPPTSSFPAPRRPVAASGSMSTLKETRDADLVEMSFADYSDGEAFSKVPTRTNLDEKEQASKPASRVIEIDSSDSEYDEANGVLVWEPTPNKLKKLSGTPRRPFATPIRNSKGTADRGSPEKSFVAGDCGESDVSHSRTPLPTVDKLKARKMPLDTLQTVKTPSKSSRRTASPRKITFTRQRDDLAKALIQELDEKVFDNQLPQDIKIVWNGRLNTTAGRASWKKTTRPNGDKTFNAEIELAVKVIDSAEKLNCTLAHELCHLAAWAIDKEMKPDHGPAFKSWGRKIMRARRDITVTTKHSYEIAYKYQWQCSSIACAKVYGRHSKSIDPTKHACGVCSSLLVQLGKDGLPIDESKRSPRKDGEWSIFAKAAFRRLKEQNPGATMIQVNQLVAAEWRSRKLQQTEQAAATLDAAMSGLKM